MDIQRPSNAKAKKIKRAAYVIVAVVVIAGVTLGLSRLKPAAPSVDRGTVWTDTVKRGPMLREVRGLGTLVPLDIHWIAALTTARVDKIVIRPGHLVEPNTVILEMSDPAVAQTLIDSQFQMKGAEADLANLRVQVNSELMNQKAIEAGVRSDYEQAKLQHEVDEKLYKEGIDADVTQKLSKVREDQLKIRLDLEEERTHISADSAQARLQAQQSHVEQARAMYDLRKNQADALHVRAGITGVLQLLPVDVGQSVPVGTNIARVADPKKLKAEIKIAETQAKDIVIGQNATVDTRNGIVKGHVIRIDPSVVNGTVTVDVGIDDPLPLGARADLSVDGTITLENLADVLYVGRPVHGQTDATISLFKVMPDDSDAVRVNVKLGRNSVNTVEILNGLQVGDKVILSDMSQWDNVDRIRLK
ncbi:MAG TPA: HlyD family efflux transporter periplasmic adaptor subunit [Candidatus Acidoferrum sp.]|jgi:HlyD family secretion protein|nr:HlyD family efflux transporter periplasmic adaptor subunit [Candidatus Acidoferrum sp.]